MAAIEAMSAKGHERFNVPYLCSEFFFFAFFPLSLLGLFGVEIVLVVYGVGG